MSYITVLSTASNIDEAKKIANELVKNHLAACVNIVKNIVSIYEWKGEFCEDEEILMIIKSKKSKFEDIEKKIKELHSYEVPEVILLDIKDGNQDYFSWIDSIVTEK